MKQLRIPAVYMRGGTSKGVFFLKDDLPSGPVVREKLLLRVIGSPDRYGKQTDGMGGATSSTSKIVILSKSERPDCDVDYLFGQVAIAKPVIDWSGNCGNLSTAVGPFAIEQGLVGAPADGTAVVRIWQANIRKRIISHVPMKDGAVQELGDFALDGVAFPAAEVRLEFLDPADDEDEGGGGGAMFPTGHRIDRLDVPGLGAIEATMINAGNPTVFVDAARLGLTGTELQKDINGDPKILALAEAVRSHGAVAMGLVKTAQEATETRQATPKIAFVARPAAYTASDGKAVTAESIDLLAHLFDGRAAPRHDRHRRGGDRRGGGDSRHDRQPSRAGRRRWPGAVRPSVGRAERRRRGARGGGPVGGQEGDDEPLGTAADGRLGARAGLS